MRTLGVRLLSCLVAGAAVAVLAAEKEDTSSQTEQLFNGKDLSGWTWVTNKMRFKIDDVWSVEDGILKCKGDPRGYIRTKRGDFHDYVLVVEWRWPENTTDGNNGVLVHTTAPGALGVWPKSIEVQLHSGDAGDFWSIGTDLDVPNEEQRHPEDRRYLNLTDNSEKPIGQWNRMEITCRGDQITVKVNDELVNHATNCSVTKGAISLQSEGTPIEFRKVELTPLD